jgi:hypothetical protein
MRRNVAFLGTAAVVNFAHTASHAGQHLMSLPGWQLVYITIVTYAAPVVAASLLWTRYRFAGAWLLAASMAGVFAFGLLYHFVIPGPDNVFTQPPGTWRTAFGVSATESNSSPDSMLAAFDQHRPLLFPIAYRMIGSVADAEDVVQEAYLRWQQARGEAHRPRGTYLPGGDANAEEVPGVPVARQDGSCHARRRADVPREQVRQHPLGRVPAQ